MFRSSFREIRRVSLWYCEDVYCVFLARRVTGYDPPEKFAF